MGFCQDRLCDKIVVMKDKKQYYIKDNDANRRLDRVVRIFLNELPLGKIYREIRQGGILINGRKVKPNYKTALGDILTIETRLIQTAAPVEKSTALRKIPLLDILYQNEYLLCLNKQAGVSVHGEGSLDQAVKQRFFDVARSSLAFTPGPLHRLDRQTTGIIFFSQNLIGAQVFSKALREKKIFKFYLGIVKGRVGQTLWQTREDNKLMITRVHSLAYSSNLDTSLALFQPITGKKHQIRKHCAAHGHNLIGDIQYGNNMTLKNVKHTSFFLHAWYVWLPACIPVKQKNITAPLPDYFTYAIEHFFAPVDTIVTTALRIIREEKRE